MKRKNYILLFALLCMCTISTWAQITEPERTVVYDMNYNGSQYYRIPSLTTAADGSLLAIADMRGSKLGDLPNDISVVCRRSTDNGKTWGDPVVIAQGMGQKKGYGDPAVVVNRNNGEVICIFAGGNGLWASAPWDPITINMSKSTDNGVTWSAPRNITDQIYQSNWYGAFAGSGSALQLKDGRLMFVVAASLSYQPNGGSLYNFAVYSDDGGENWKVSQQVAQRGDEAKVIELEDGSILMSIRNPSKGYRLFSVSKDRGETWSDATINTSLQDPACNGDIIRYPTSADGQTMLLHSLPASSSTRENVTVYASFDEGKTWPVKKLITDGYSAYSSLTVLEDGTIGILVENGKWDGNLPGDDGFVLEFVRFTKDWLIGEEQGGGEELPQGVLSCDGSNRYMSIPNSADFFPAAGGEYTVTCRVKVPAYINGSNMRFVCTRGYTGTSNGATSGYELIGGNSYDESFSVNLSLVDKPWGASHIWASGAILEGEWAHLAWTFNGSSQQSCMYVDGMEVWSSKGENVTKKSIPQFATNAWANELPVLVGAGYTNVDGTECTPAYFATAEIDDVRFFNRTLSQAEVTADKTMTSVGATTQGLVAAYDFENIEGNVVKDISGNGHNGELVNFPSQSVKHKVTVEAPAETEGTLRVLNGDKEVPNGFMVAEGTTLTVEAVATEKYKLEAINVNGVAIENNTFVLTEDVIVSATFTKKDPNAIEYEIPSAEENIRTAGDRLLKDITFEGATLEGVPQPFTIEVNNTTEVYVDRTDLTMIASPNDVINTSWTFRKNIIWMSYYIYIDYNHDGVFNETNELVSFTHFNADEKGPNSKWVNSLGEEVNKPEPPTTKAPAFTIPADAAGKTRVRFKVDWNSKDPCGNPASDNKIGANRGTMVDFNINFSSGMAVTFAQPENGTLEVAKEDGTVINSGDEVDNGTVLTVKTTANEGYELNAVKVNGKVLTSNTFTVTAPTEIVADFMITNVYCKPGNDRRNDSNSRRIETITVSGATFNETESPFDITLDNEYSQETVYQDHTNKTLYANQGDKLNVTWTLRNTAEWIHYYMYIDYDHDGLFNEENELVSFTAFNIGVDGADNWVNSLGESASAQGPYKSLPAFSIPSDALTGKTRARFKADWNSKNPCGDKDIHANTHGTIVDFNIYIDKPNSQLVTIEQAEGGVIELTDEEGNVIESGSRVAVGKTLNVKATPNEGFQTVKVLVNGEVLEGETFKVLNETVVTAVFTDKLIATFSISEGSTMTVTAGTAALKSGDLFSKGSDLVLSFNCPAGSKVSELLINGVDQTAGIENNTYMITNCQENQTIVATVSKNQYTITIAETTDGNISVRNITAGGKVENGGTVSHGDEIEITVEPISGFYVESFMLNNEDKTLSLSTSNTYTTQVTEAIELAATFKEASYILTWTVEGDGTVSCFDYDNSIDVNNGDKVGMNHAIMFTLTPDKAKEAQVLGITQNEQEISLDNELIDKSDADNWVFWVSMEEDINLTFTFSKTSGIANAEIFIGYNEATQTLLIPENATAEIYDLAGNKVLNVEETTTSTSALATGCYLVKVTTANAVKTLKLIKK